MRARQDVNRPDFQSRLASFRFRQPYGPAPAPAPAPAATAAAAAAAAEATGATQRQPGQRRPPQIKDDPAQGVSAMRARQDVRRDAIQSRLASFRFRQPYGPAPMPVDPAPPPMPPMPPPGPNFLAGAAAPYIGTRKRRPEGYHAGLKSAPKMGRAPSYNIDQMRAHAPQGGDAGRSVRYGRSTLSRLVGLRAQSDPRTDVGGVNFVYENVPFTRPHAGVPWVPFQTRRRRQPEG